MKRVFAALVVTAAAMVSAAYGQRTETDYQPIGAPPAAVAAVNETSYNPKGTVSDSTFALLTVRREDPEYRGFLLGMQQAAINLTKKPLNVAPFEQKELTQQHRELRHHGAEVFLIDAPEGASAMQFLQNSSFLQIQAVLLSRELVKGPRQPIVVYSPMYEAERAGEEAIRQIGDVEKTVAYVTPSVANAEAREAMVKMFRKPFENVAQKIKLVELGKSEGVPDVVVALTPQDSASLLKKGRADFPGAKIVLTGESDELREGLAAGKFDVRVRPDYNLILGFAMKESRAMSEIPPMALPTADVWRGKAEEKQQAPPTPQ